MQEGGVTDMPLIVVDVTKTKTSRKRTEQQQTRRPRMIGRAAAGGRVVGRRGGQGHGRDHHGDHGRGRGRDHGRALVAPGRGRRGFGRGGRGRRGGGILPEAADHEEGPPPPFVPVVQLLLPPPQVVPFAAIQARCPLCDHVILPAPADVTITSPDDMFRFGLAVLGWDTIIGVSLDRFRAHYGIDPEGMFAMFNDLKEQEQELEPGVSTDPFCLLMAMNHLRCYDTEHCMAGRWRLQEATIRVKVRKYIFRIQQLKEKKVVQKHSFCYCMIMAILVSHVVHHSLYYCAIIISPPQDSLGGVWRRALHHLG